MHLAKYLKAEQVCERYDIGRSTLYELVDRNVLPPAYRFARRAARWSIDELEAAERAVGDARRQLERGARAGPGRSMVDALNNEEAGS